MAKSPRADKIFCAPGNAGIAEYAQCVPIGAMEFDKLRDFAKENAIDLCIVGMDDPLVGGLVYVLEEAGIRTFGPKKNAAILEGSKAFSKDLMFKGVIFFGLMLTEDGPKVLEYNARFGDPEAQVVLPRMKNDILEVMEACIDGTLDQVDLQFEDNAAVCVVLASEGYPVSYEKGFPITGLEEFKKHEGYYCFHAGTKFNEDQIVTNGGRVLGVTAKGKDLKEARANAYAATEWVNFKNKYMRHDIGKAIDEA